MKTNVKNEYLWILKPINKKSKKIRDKAKKQEARMVGIKLKSLFVLVSVLLITNCSMMPSAKPVEVRTIAEPVPLYHPPLPLEVGLVDIDWEILTPDLMKEYLENYENGSAPAIAYYSLTSKEYENLSMNMAEIKRYLRDTLSIVKYYRDYDKEDNAEEKVSENK